MRQGETVALCRTWLTDRFCCPFGSGKGLAVQEAAGMVDRWNRMFLRCLRALRDMRRSMPPVVVNNPGPVNIAQQQVNVAEPF